MPTITNLPAKKTPNHWDDWCADLSPFDLAWQNTLKPLIEAPEPQWHVVLVDELEVEPRVVSCVDEAEMIAVVMRQSETVWACPFFGLVTQYTQKSPAGLRYLILPNGIRKPLFDPDPELPPASSYYIGEMPLDDQFELATLMQPQQTSAARVEGDPEDNEGYSPIDEPGNTDASEY